MAKYKINITNQKEVLKEVRAESSAIFNNILKYALNTPEFKDELVDLVVRFLKRTDVWEALSGSYAGYEKRDLQAQFGLEDGYLVEVEDDVRNLLRDIIHISGSGITFGGKKVREAVKANIKFDISFKDIETLFPGIPSGTYISENGEIVPWLEWLLFGETLEHRIIYRPTSEVVQKYSRTGRAIMTERIHIRGMEGKIWSTDELQYDKHFFYEIFEDDNFLNELEKLLILFMSEAADDV